MENIIGKTLYAVTKTGNVKTWCAEVFGTPDEQPSDATITITTQTKLDGKKVLRHDVITEGKNLGKSNETTPYEQALSEARSRYNKKIDQGYGLEIPTDTTKSTSNGMGLPRPMLAHPIDKVKEIEFPAYFQPKLDGHRCIVTKKNGEMIMYSRQGKPITTMDHILSFLEGMISEGQFLDGELYLHGEALQNIGSYIKKLRPESKQIYYYVYDIIMDKPYRERLKLLNTIFLDSPEVNSPATLISTREVHSMGETMAYFGYAIDDGFEGGILRTPDQGYLAGFRSRNLLKIKKFDDSEHKIVDVIEGKDRLVNDTELKVAVFVCETPEGQRFECTAFGDQHEKDRIWHTRKDFIGKTLTVKHSGYTKEGKPWHCVALRIREDI